MTTENTDTRSRWRGSTKALGLVAAGAVAGGILAGTLTASASGSSDTAQQQPGTYGGMHDGGMHHFGGPGPVRGDEKALSSADAGKVKAAALKAVPGGTVYRVETDAGDGAYEAHMTKSDGTPVTVKLDKSFHLVKVEAGMGLGDPGPANQPGMGGPSA